MGRERNRAAFRRGRDGDDRFAPLERDAPRRKSTWPLCHCRTGFQLSRSKPAGQINLQSRVDCDHVVIASNPLRIVGLTVGRNSKMGCCPRSRTVLGSQGKTDYDLARLEVLLGSGQDSGFNQWNHAIGNQFTVDSEILRSMRKGRTASGMPPIPVCSTAHPRSGLLRCARLLHACQ